ncbi:MAG: glutathione S-transferase family protein [Notoacmeibacter sp.]|nr:glutathione S-transferase family protein [Notoacmeibacter sp.]
MTIRLYHGEATRSARILWLLAELGLEHETVRMTLAEVIQSVEFRQTNTLGRVPFLIDGPIRMMESLAIMQHLAETRDTQARLWVRPGEPERPEFLQWLQFAETIAVHVQNLNQQCNVLQPPKIRSAVTIKVETRRLEKTISIIEDRLSDREYLLERGFTIADIAMAYSVFAGGMFTSLAPFPAVNAWLERLRLRPACGDALSGSLMTG